MGTTCDALHPKSTTVQHSVSSSFDDDDNDDDNGDDNAGDGELPNACDVSNPTCPNPKSRNQTCKICSKIVLGHSGGTMITTAMVEDVRN